MLAILSAAVTVALLCASNLGSIAHGYKQKSLEVLHPYTFEKPEPSGRDVIVRMMLRNGSRMDESLIGASSTIAEHVEIVVPKAAGAPADAHSAAFPLVIKAGQEVEFTQSSAHLRLVGLKKPLAAYDTLPVTLFFEKAGRLSIDVMIEAAPEQI